MIYFEADFKFAFTRHLMDIHLSQEILRGLHAGRIPPRFQSYYDDVLQAPKSIKACSDKIEMCNRNGIKVDELVAESNLAINKLDTLLENKLAFTLQNFESLAQSLKTALSELSEINKKLGLALTSYSKTPPALPPRGPKTPKIHNFAVYVAQPKQAPQARVEQDNQVIMPSFTPASVLAKKRIKDAQELEQKIKRKARNFNNKERLNGEYLSCYEKIYIKVANEGNFPTTMEEYAMFKKRIKKEAEELNITNPEINQMVAESELHARSRTYDADFFAGVSSSNNNDRRYAYNRY